MAFTVGDSDINYIGIKRRNDSLVYVKNNNKIFEIGSITKTFTATMLAKLVYDGNLLLDEPIKNILPVKMNKSALNGEEVTLLYLANHTSGFPKEPNIINFDWSIPGSPYKFYDTVKLYDYLSKRITLLSTPGEKRVYFNLGGGLLGHLLALKTGRSYEDIQRESFCETLGLHMTFVNFDSIKRQHLVPGRDPLGNIVQNWELNVLCGGGGIKSTAEDMAKYIRAHLTDTTFYFLTQQSTIQYTENNSAGLGWVWYMNGGKNYVSATGGTGGYSCWVVFERSTRTGIVLLSNVSPWLATVKEPVTQMCIQLHGTLSH